MIDTKRLRRIGSVSTACVALSSAGTLVAPAYAQETSAVDPQPQVEPDRDQAGTEDQGALRDIVVTAQRRSESIQSVPIAVTALDEKALDSPIIQDIRDIAGRVPSLVVDSVGAGPSAAAISIRGISFEDIEKSFDPAVGVVVDGVFISTNTGQLLDSFDLERLEVLRGPQGTLFGRNTIGGVINVTRTKPTDDFGVRGRFSYANYDTKSGRLVVNSGKIGDFLSLKAFGYYDKTDGFYRNAIDGSRDGRYETLTGGLTALIEPTSNFSAEITYEHMRERGETVSVPESDSSELICAFAGAPGFSPKNECNRFTAPDRGAYVTYETAPRGVRNDTDAVTGNIEWTLSPTLSLYSVTGWRKNRENVMQDFDGSSADFFATGRKQRFRQFSQEVRLVANLADRVNLLVGGYYFDSRYVLNQFTNFGAVFGGFRLDQYVDHHAKSYAGFADAQIKVTDKLKVSAGIRYTEDKKRIFNNYGQINALVQVTQPSYDGQSCVTVTGLVPGAGIPAYGPANNCDGSASFGKVTYRANADYEIGPDKRVYASFSKGFRSGGFNGRAASPTSLGPYQPESVQAYEVGLKADWLDKTLRTNLALYYTKYDNKQEEVVQPTPPGSANPQETVVKNAASANIKGFELETIASVSDNLSFTGSFSYTDAKYDSFFNDVVGLTVGSARDGIPDDVSTLTLRRAPKWQWSAGMNYTRDVGHGRFDASALLRFQSKYATCIVPDKPVVPGAVTNEPRCVTQDRENISAQIGYTYLLGDGREVSLSLFGRNLTDFRDIAGTLPVAGLFTFSGAYQPRTYGVELGFKF